MNILEELHLGLYEKALPLNMTWHEKLTVTREAGYSFLEMSIDATSERLLRLDWDVEAIKEIHKAIDNTGIPILSLALSANRCYPLGDLDSNVRTMGIEIVRKAIDLAARVGIRIIQLSSYDVYDKPGNAKTQQNFMDSILRCTEYAARKAVTLALETMDTAFVDTIIKAQEIVRKIDSPYLQIYADVGNIVARGYDVLQEIYALDNHVVAIHLKDTQKGVFRRVPYGDGIVNFESIFKALLNVNYQGLLVAEMWGDDLVSYLPYVGTANIFLRNTMKDERRMENCYENHGMSARH